MVFKLKIPKKYLFRFLLIILLAGSAMFFDYYLENNPQTLKELQAENETADNGHEPVYLFSQTFSINVKAPVQKFSLRNMLGQAHDKFLRKCHQMQNIQALKIENEILPKPFFSAPLYMLLNQQRFSGHDDEPFDC